MTERLSRRPPPWSAIGFTDAVYGSDLPPSARLVAIVLRDEFFRAGRGKVSISRIAQRSGLGRTTVCRHLMILDEAGFVVRRVPSIAGSLGHGAMTHYALCCPANVSHSGTREDETVPVTNVSHSGTSYVSRSGTSSVSQRDTLPKQGSRARGARSAGAPHATAPHVVVEVADIRKPGWCGLWVWADQGAEVKVVRELLRRNVERLASDLMYQGFDARAFTLGDGNPAWILELRTTGAESACQQIAGWLRAARYDVRFGSPEPTSHDAAPAPTNTNTNTEEMA